MDLVLDAAGLIAVFVLAHGLGSFTMSHRRNTEAIAVSLALGGFALYAFGILGLMFFAVGVVHGACDWISRCDAANDALLKQP